MKDFFELDYNKQCQVASEALQRMAQAAMTDPNVRSIETLAAKQGLTIEALWADICRSQGIEANGHHLTNAFLGGLFSLDGVHPTNTGYAVIANKFITTLNQTRGTSIPLVNVNEVASTDPLIFAAAVRAVSLSKHVSPATAAALRALLLHTSSQK